MCLITLISKALEQRHPKSAGTTGRSLNSSHNPPSKPSYDRGLWRQYEEKDFEREAQIHVGYLSVLEPNVKRSDKLGAKDEIGTPPPEGCQNARRLAAFQVGRPRKACVDSDSYGYPNRITSDFVFPDTS